MIDQRESKRERKSGHWKTDLTESKRIHQGVAQINIERKTRYMVGYRLKGKYSSPAIQKINELNKREYVKTITSDNGSENAYFKGSTVKEWYFCHPYHSWEKGSVENSIRRLRKSVLKGTNLSLISQERLGYAINLLNNMLRKCPNGMTAKEAYEKERTKIDKSLRWDVST